MLVLVAEDHPLFAEALAGLLVRRFPGAELETGGSFHDVLQSLSGTRRFDIVILDFSIPGMNGAEGVGRVVEAAKTSPVVIISGVAKRADVEACITAGARGFLPKTLDAEILGNALSVVAAGGTYVPAELLMETRQIAPIGQPSFTAKEFEILHLVVAGRSNKQIARIMNLQEVTIKAYLSRIYRKLGIRNRAQAAVAAIGAGIVVDAGVV